MCTRPQQLHARSDTPLDPGQPSDTCALERQAGHLGSANPSVAGFLLPLASVACRSPPLWSLWTSQVWCVVPARVRAWATSSWQTSGRRTPSARWARAGQTQAGRQPVIARQARSSWCHCAHSTEAAAAAAVLSLQVVRCFEDDDIVHVSGKVGVRQQQGPYQKPSHCRIERAGSLCRGSQQAASRQPAPC